MKHIKHSGNIRYFLYVRRSQDSEDRQMASLDDQILEMKKIAMQSNIEIVDIIEESQSAKKPGRPKFNQMLERIHNGEATGILCWKLNRLARNPIDGGQIMWLLQQGVIQQIKTYGRDYKPTDNVMIMAVELGMANQFLLDLSADVKRGMRQKAERGWMAQSWLPIGYSHNSGYSAGDDEIISNSDLLIVKKLFGHFLEGTYSISDIQRMASTLGLRNKKGKEYSHNTFLNMLKNPMYMGKFEWRNEKSEYDLKQGRHEAIITETQYNRVQLLLGKRGKPTRINEYDFPYRGAGLVCGECGHSITAEHKVQCICTGCKHKFSCKTEKTCSSCHLSIEEMTNPSFVDRTYYRCTKKSKIHKCTQGGVEQDELTKEIDAVLKDIHIDPDFYHWAKEALKVINKEEVYENQEVVYRLAKRKSDLMSRLERVVVMRADGEISSEQLQQLKSDAERELKQIESESVGINDKALNWLDIADGYLTFSETASRVFNETTDLSVKREILQALGSNLSIMDKKAFIVLTRPIVGIRNARIATYNELNGLELKKALEEQGLSKEKDRAFSTLCAELEAVRTFCLA